MVGGSVWFSFHNQRFGGPPQGGPPLFWITFDFHPQPIRGRSSRSGKFPVFTAAKREASRVHRRNDRGSIVNARRFALVNADPEEWQDRTRHEHAVALSMLNENHKPGQDDYVLVHELTAAARRNLGRLHHFVHCICRVAAGQPYLS